MLTGSQVFAAPYTVVGQEFRAGTAQPWSSASYQLLGLRDVPYAVHPDGKRIATTSTQSGRDSGARFW